MTLIPGRRWVALAVVLAMSSLVACTSGGGDDEGRRRPSITRPLDAKAYANRDRICDLLPPKDVAELGYQSPGDATTGDIKTHEKKHISFDCSRFPPPAPSLYYELFVTFDILEYDYQVHGDSKQPKTKEPVIEPIIISRQPAILVDSDLKRDETCAITVGLSDNQGFRISGSQNYLPSGDGSLEGDQRACDQVIAVVEAIIANLEGDR